MLCGSNKTTWTWVWYELERNNSWPELTYLNKILVLAGWNSALSVNTNSWIGGYQIFFITVSATRLLQNFGKHSWKHCLSVKFRLAAYAFIGYDFIELMIFLYRLNIYPEVFYTSTPNSMTQLDDDLLFRKVIFLS